MSYENAKSTILLATHCLCCGRPLRDAVSVEVGIGPDCREKYGYLEAVSETVRSTCNKLVHEAAVVQKNDVKRVLDIANEIETLGLAKLADTVRTRFVEVRIVDAEAEEMRWDRDTRTEKATGRTIKVVEVHTPYHPRFAEVLRNRVRGYRRPVYGTDEHGKRKFSHWEVARDDARAMLGVLAECFPGVAASGPKGSFFVPDLATFESSYSKSR